MEIEHPCNFDNVTVYDGTSIMDRQIGVFCGTSLPSPVRSSGQSLLVTFNTDRATTLQGFEAEFDFVESKSKQCMLACIVGPIT